MPGRLRLPTDNLRGIVISFFLAVGLLSCYEAIEGCLDSQAVNFDFSADNACDGCCSYPNLIINFNRVFGKRDF